MLNTLLEKANNLPLLPGVYLMLDERGEVIYVGKAKKLKNRVSSYFHGDHLPKVAAMVEKVSDFNVIVANSEFEALILENSLIKQHRPHYNILLKDDKGYPFVRLDLNSEYPRFGIVNHTAKDGATYFGPYGGRNSTREIIQTVSKTLLLPDCSRKFPQDIGKERPCLNYHMNTCAGWCLKDVPQEDYRKAIDQAVLILEGKTDDLIESLQTQMEDAAEQLRFEIMPEDQAERVIEIAHFLLKQFRRAQTLLGMIVAMTADGVTVFFDAADIFPAGFVVLRWTADNEKRRRNIRFLKYVENLRSFIRRCIVDGQIEHLFTQRTRRQHEKHAKQRAEYSFVHRTHIPFELMEKAGRKIPPRKTC